MKTAVPVSANDAGSKVSLRLLELNSLHAAFWQKEAEIQNRLMENEANLEITNLMVIEEYDRPIPIGFKKSYGDLLKQADAARVIVLRHQARKGGQAAKTGPLQQFIIQCVQSSPSMSEHDLVRRLRKQNGVVVDQESDCPVGQPLKVHFIDENGAEESAPLSALKDRLARAKKKIRAKR